MHREDIPVPVSIPLPPHTYLGVWQILVFAVGGMCRKDNGKSPGAHCMGAFTEQTHPPTSEQAEPSNSSYTSHKTVKTSLTIQAIFEQET